MGLSTAVQPCYWWNKGYIKTFSISFYETSVKSALQAGTVLVAIASRTILATKFANFLAIFVILG